ncbi:M56 family metallopeptidase [Acetanaerobacterium elongatum]|uniref:Signal transducer regulating beta-lactamase production, contains metallopeptidase domain n=1 Tax=Acetanaerobacterium elongatum TaxID=258515 RepID=A0A1G9XQW4_9FIRM|nr:M56 family metallopeptidase [Acetanaerobacterium elongatum]SDM99212.1 Signal transducer regulating beta-lactamase production, contains metallopeptidase domain [Acetanaerobacterium elongatum]
MTALFNTVLSMSLTAGYAAFGVLLIRLLLKKAPKVFSYALWAVVWFRLVCPVSFESMFSLIPSGIPKASQAISKPSFINSTVINPALSTELVYQQTFSPQFSPIMHTPPTWREVLAVVWLAGVFLLLCYSAVSYLRLRHRLATAVRVRDNLYETDRIQTAFVMGFIRPKIYLPAGVSPNELDYILKHEKVHLKRVDHLIKPIAFLAVCVHWFNPLVWVCWYLMCRDMEMSCDESVIKRLGGDIKKDYSGSLLTFSERQSGLFTPLAFGETGVKARIKNILSYKKPAFWVLILCVAAVAAVTVGFMANPRTAFDLEKAEASAKQFTTQETDLVKIGEQAAMHYYSAFMGENIPEEHRITELSVTNVRLVAGDAAEFCVSINIDFTTPTAQTYFTRSNGKSEPAKDGKGVRCYDRYMEFRVKSLGNSDYLITEVGTGGAAYGLAPVADNNEGIEQQSGTDNNQNPLTTAYLFDTKNPQYDANGSPIPLAQYNLSKEDSDGLYALMGNKEDWEALPEGEYPSLNLPRDISLQGTVMAGPVYEIFGDVNGKTLITFTKSLLLSKMPSEYYAPKEVYSKIKEYLQKLTPVQPQSKSEIIEQLEQEIADVEVSLSARSKELTNTQRKLQEVQTEQNKASSQNETIITELQKEQSRLVKEIKDLQSKIENKKKDLARAKQDKSLEDIAANQSK